MARISQYIPICLLAVLILTHNSVQGFKCYSCPTSCKHPFSKAGVATVECTGVCLKTKTGKTVMRTCSSAKIETTCKTSGEVTACACDADLCNGVTKVAVSMATTLLAVFTKLF